MIDGYEVILNFRSTFYATKGSRLYSPNINFFINDSQDLYKDIRDFTSKSRESNLIKYLSSNPSKSGLNKRILTALQWYNRSLSFDIEEDVALVNLAIAFECLLNLEHGYRLTARFKESVKTLLGDPPRLTSWLNQFYEARSQIVHKGKTNFLKYIPTDDQKLKPSDNHTHYRSLLSVSRQIFQLCLSTLIHGSLMTENNNLSSMFYTNQERFEEICKILRKSNRAPEEDLIAISPYINEINDFLYIEEHDIKIDTILAATQLAMKTFIKTMPSLDNVLSELIEEFTNLEIHSEYYEAYKYLDEIYELYKIEVREGKNVSIIILRLLESVWMYMFPNYEVMRNKRDTG